MIRTAETLSDEMHLPPSAIAQRSVLGLSTLMQQAQQEQQLAEAVKEETEEKVKEEAEAMNQGRAEQPAFLEILGGLGFGDGPEGLEDC